MVLTWWVLEVSYWDNTQDFMVSASNIGVALWAFPNHTPEMLLIITATGQNSGLIGAHTGEILATQYNMAII